MLSNDIVQEILCLFGDGVSVRPIDFEKTLHIWLRHIGGVNYLYQEYGIVPDSYEFFYPYTLLKYNKE